MKGFQIRRDLLPGRYPLDRLARGFGESASLLRLFGGAHRLREFLSHVEVVVASFSGYMWVNDGNGCLTVSREYLQEADEVHLYLDLVHEIVHLRQLSEGKDLFDDRYSYDQRPTELEAYGITVEEARRMGLSEDFIRDYLKVDWTTGEQHRRLLVALGLSPRPGGARP
ncbi:MAG: hypothetical protein ACE5HJ_00090 [Thermoplasmata archaeon]